MICRSSSLIFLELSTTFCVDATRSSMPGGRGLPDTSVFLYRRGGCCSAIRQIVVSPVRVPGALLIPCCCSLWVSEGRGFSRAENGAFMKLSSRASANRACEASATRGICSLGTQVQIPHSRSFTPFRRASFGMTTLLGRIAARLKPRPSEKLGYHPHPRAYSGSRAWPRWANPSSSRRSGAREDRPPARGDQVALDLPGNTTTCLRPASCLKSPCILSDD